MVTTSAGSFLFGEIEPGSYKLEVAHDSSAFDTATYTVLVNSDGSVLPDSIELKIYTTGFAHQETLVDVHGKVVKLNGDAETAVTVTLLDNEGAVVKTATTQSLGLFLFPQQKPGVYKIRLEKGLVSDEYDILLKNDGKTIPELPMELMIGI
jgi:hypothetical protein